MALTFSSVNWHSHPYKVRGAPSQRRECLRATHTGAIQYIIHHLARASDPALQ
jgi:hypothetical protein